jgi:hypothetical protein
MKQTTLSKLLLDAPTWDESDVMDFHEKIREGYENWKIKVDPMSRPTSYPNEEPGNSES